MATNPKLEEIANALMRNKTTSMIAPNEYTDRTRSGQANIDRRSKMIELLQGQANAPIERFGYGGVEAVTPPAAYLGKILSGVMAQYQSGKAGQEQEALDKYKEQAQTQDMKTMIEMMNKGTGPTDVSSVNDTSYIKDPVRRAQQDASLAEPIMPQQPTYTGGIPQGTVSTGQPIMPVTEIQERRYSMRTPEGQAELLRQTAADKQSRAEMLTRQLDKQTAADEKQRIADARIAERALDDERRVTAAALKSEEDIAAAKLLADVNVEKAQLAAEQAYKPKPLSSKDLNVVKTKLASIEEVKKQYNTLKTNFDLIKNTGAVGLTSPLYKFDDNAQKYDTSLNTIRNLITGLTRIPGVGSQSDLEARIANQSLPERTVDKGAAAMGQQLDALKSLISGYEDVSKGILEENQSYYPSKKEPVKLENIAEKTAVIKPLASITVNGIKYTRPADMTDEDWNSYKTEMGGK